MSLSLNWSCNYCNKRLASLSGFHCFSSAKWYGQCASGGSRAACMRTASAAKDLFCDHYCLMWATFDLLAIRVAAAHNNEQYRPCSIGALIMLTIYGMLT